MPELIPPSLSEPLAKPQEALALLPVTADRPGWGSADALATVSVFGDLDCLHTRRALRTLLRLTASLGSRLRFAYYHAPLGMRGNGRAAALALNRIALGYGSEASYRFLVEAARSVAPAQPEELARWLSAAALPAVQGITEGSAQKAVQQDERLAAALDVRMTPTLFVNGLRIEGAPRELTLKHRINEEFRSTRWLRGQGISVEQSYLRRVKKNLIHLEADAADRSCVPLDGAPLEGPAAALLTIVEFSDFECTHCRTLWPSLGAILQRHQGNIRRSWRSFTTVAGRRSRRLALFAFAARASAGDVGFWALHDALLESDADLEDPQLLSLAGKLGFDGELLLAAVHDPRRLQELELDQGIAQELGLSGTPTLFVNGRKLSGAVPLSVLSQVMDQELDAARRLVHEGTSPERFQDLLCTDPVPRPPTAP